MLRLDDGAEDPRGPCGEQDALIERLPDELLTLVFSFLSPGVVCNNVAQVCSKWKALHVDPSIYRVFEFRSLEDGLDSKLKFLRLAPWLVSLTLEHQVETTAILETVCSCNQRLQYLTLRSCRGSLDRDNIVSSVLKKIIKRCPQLRELKIKDCKGLTCVFYKMVGNCLPLLRKVHFINTLNFGSDALLSLANCLELQEIRACHKFQSIEEGITTDADVEVLVDKLKHTLRRVELNGVGWSEKVYLTLVQFTSLTQLSIRFALKLSDSGMMALSSMQNLRRLDLAMCLNVSEATWLSVFVSPAMRNLRKLSLVICSITDQVTIAIAKNLNQLEKICVSGCVGLGPNGISWLIMGCSALKTLQLLFVEPTIKPSLLLIPACLPGLKKLHIISFSYILDAAMAEIQEKMPDIELKYGDSRWSEFFSSILQLTDVTLEIV